MKNRGMDFPLCPSGVYRIWLQWALLGPSLEAQAMTCLSLVPVWRILAVLKIASLRYIMYKPWKWRQQAPPTCQHCTVSHKTANLTHEHHSENPECHYCTFLSCNAFIAWHSGKRQLPQFILTFEEHVSCAWTIYCLQREEILSNPQ